MNYATSGGRMRPQRSNGEQFGKVIIIFAWLIALGVLAGSQLRAAEFRVGIAVRDDPEPLLPVSGGVGPSHPVNRKLGDLTVRALVLDDGGTRVAIVGTDLGLSLRAGRPGASEGDHHSP